jgi:germination protein M
VQRLLLVGFVAVAVLVGCGGDDDATPTETTTVKAYFLRDGQVWPVAREIEETDDNLTSAVDELRLGPTDEEASLGLTTALPETQDTALSRLALAQLVYTMTQFSSTDSAEIDGVDYTRSDFEEQTPSVLVESPLPFEEVTSPLTATGTANTFEATFQYELVDADGNVVDENFVTATSGSGTRGTFELTTGAFDEVAALRVFESSAEDGSRMNEVEIPLSLSD